MENIEAFRLMSGLILVPLLVFQILLGGFAPLFDPTIIIQQKISQNLQVNNQTVKFTPLFPVEMIEPTIDYDDLIRNYYQDPPHFNNIDLPQPIEYAHIDPLYTQQLYFGMEYLGSTYLLNKEKYEQKYNSKLVETSEYILPNLSFNSIRVVTTVSHYLALLVNGIALFTCCFELSTKRIDENGFFVLTSIAMFFGITFYFIIYWITFLFIDYLRIDFKESSLCYHDGEYYNFCQTLSGSTNDYPGVCPNIINHHHF
ncbi:hypothetical protein DFA_05007 [Cavenderia fasciculata]|uniref:Transmembrane protein n=1 Tax=Cavenderia fasciculata TaxID=261658 RepID=F4PMY4_CACFS|nr:uncharacterized protein DFA_05007 [Cavenderia fasciculata]EGG22877.1 hypothetical protein DFA_05007 [Cavenderia fasciculata]|eukprot:XP_004360728.1 hypothetical protein DFA_05007 [Cavenderia fasciculata]